MRPHRYHVLTLDVGYTDRLLGPDIPQYKFDDNLDSDDENYIKKYYNGGEVTGVKYPVIKRLHGNMSPSAEGVSILYIGSKKPIFAVNSHDGTDTKEQSYARKVYGEVCKLKVKCDIAVTFNYGDEKTWPLMEMNGIYGFIESLMHLNHCAMFSFDNVIEQYEYDIMIDGSVIKCLHMNFDTESG